MDAGSDQTLYFALVDELVPQVRYLLEQKWTSSADIWRAQNDLIKFQVALQSAIAEERASAKLLKDELAEVTRSKSTSWKTKCRSLQERIQLRETRIADRQQALLLSRRLGDAWAWLLLGFDEKVIEPLTRNRPIGHTSSGHSLLGVQSIAEVMSNAGAGFPVIHDMTDCLRVGDITFVSPGQLPLTMEVKSHKESEADGVVSLRVEVHIIGTPSDAARWHNINLKIPVMPASADDAPEALAETKPLILKAGSRLSRQLKRMQQARAWQVAIPGELIDLDDSAQGVLAHAHVDGKAHHWDIIRDLANKAKAEGFASQPVDGAFVYMAMYSETPLRALDNLNTLLHGAQMAKDVASSGIWLPDPAQNRIAITTSLTHLSDSAPLNVLPFVWYPLPHDMIADMVLGKLFFVVLINLGRIAEALRTAGLDAELPSNEADYLRNFLHVSRRQSLDDMTSVKVELHGLWYYAHKLSLEFLSLPGFTSIAMAMMTVSTDHLNHAGE